MKILFITDNFPPETNAPASRTFEHVSEWVRQGAEVTVVTCAPNFQEGKCFRVTVTVGIVRKKFWALN